MRRVLVVVEPHPAMHAALLLVVLVPMRGTRTWTALRLLLLLPLGMLLSLLSKRLLSLSLLSQLRVLMRLHVRLPSHKRLHRHAHGTQRLVLARLRLASLHLLLRLSR